ncbi:MAG: Kelch repeat-containing protein, partial [Acidimicrobiales bacterium]
MVLVPGPAANQLIILGGLTGAGVSASGVYAVDTTDGRLSWIANLAGPLHDASGVVLGGDALLFGGGNASGSVATVQSLPVTGLAGSSPPPGSAPALTARVVGRLPKARSDSSAVTIGSSAYVVGGYDGTTGDRSVLATTTGTSFRSVASLPVAVRYTAAGVLGGQILVFGGLGVGGANAGKPLTTIQQVDPATGTARVVGTLPEPLYGAAAATLGGVLYVAGGLTASTSSGVHAVTTVWTYDPTTHQLLAAGQLRVPVAHTGVAVLGSRMWLVGGRSNGGAGVSAVQMVEPNRTFGTAGVPGAGSPYFGDKLLIADEGNGRLLVVNDTGTI